MIYSKVKSFLKAVLGPNVDKKTYEERLNKCSNCIWNVQKNTRNYCRECGCPKNRFWFWSELKIKSKYKYSECPRKRWDK